MKTNAERPFPYVKFRMMKKFTNPYTTPDGNQTVQQEEKAEDSYFRMDGVHNSVEALQLRERAGHIIVGYGNLEDRGKFSSILAYCDRSLGNGPNPELYRSVMEERVQKAKVERSKAEKGQ